MESDWRKFRDMVPRLRERYLAEHNARMAGMLTDPRKNETERFWDAMGPGWVQHRDTEITKGHGVRRTDPRPLFGDLLPLGLCDTPCPLCLCVRIGFCF
jgi:hypothetical protein